MSLPWLPHREMTSGLEIDLLHVSLQIEDKLCARLTKHDVFILTDIVIII